MKINGEIYAEANKDRQAQGANLLSASHMQITDSEEEADVHAYRHWIANYNYAFGGSS